MLANTGMYMNQKVCPHTSTDMCGYLSMIYILYMHIQTYMHSYLRTDVRTYIHAHMYPASSASTVSNPDWQYPNAKGV